ncbi:MAG: peptide chain release factor N(5)-glutamine methyltransferase [Smithella sp.]|jgi:release factor glutamine methyltransferase
MTVRDIINEASHALETVGIPSARLDAEVLLSFVLGCDRLEFLKNPEMSISEVQFSSFRNLVARRVRWEPVAYITGRKEFWTFTLEVNKDVLIPRPDTEVIVEETLEICRKLDSSEINILDIGTGSGAIALTLATEISNARIVATDISAAALALAKKNACALKLDNKIDFCQGNLFEPVEGVFDIIVCNPPYISAQDYDDLPAGVKDYEPSIALLAGKSGLEFYEKLIYQAAEFLQKNGWLLMEIGAKQENEVQEIIEESGFYDSIEMRKDYAGLPRVMRARRK